MRPQIASLVLFAVSSALPASQAGVKEPSETSGTSSARPVMTITETEDIPVAFLDRTGPYWSAGSSLATVRRTMTAHGQPGPMFTRYLEGPDTAFRGEIRMEVGYFATPEHHPSAPFKAGVHRAQLVAQMALDAPFASPSRYLPLMRRWIEEHGYVIDGPITEIYTGGSSTEATSGTEIRISVRKRPPPPAPPPEQPRVDVAPVSSTETKTGKPVKTTPPEGTPGRRRKAASTRAAVTQKRPSVNPVTGAPRRAPARRPVNPPPAPRTAVKVADLLTQGRFEEVAGWLLPDRFEGSPAEQVWLGHVASRVIAAAKGIRTIQPETAANLDALAAAVAARYEVVSATFAVDPLDHATVRLDPEETTNASDKQAVLKDLDTLLWRISLKDLDAVSATERVGDIIQRTGELVYWDSPPGD